MKDKNKSTFLFILLIVMVLLEILLIVGYVMITKSDRGTPESSGEQTSSGVTYEQWLETVQTEDVQNGTSQNTVKEVNFGDRYNDSAP